VPIAVGMNHIHHGPTPTLTNHRNRRTAAMWLLGALVVLTALTGATRAEAGVLVQSAGNCEAPAPEQPFLRWLDPAKYVLAGDGDFDRDAAGWQRAGAQVVADNEPWNVHRSARSAALRLRSGASATSPVVCVGLLHPTLRLFARNSGSILGPLQVEVLFEDASGSVHALTIGTLVGGGWAPTVPMPILANLLALLPGQETPVQFRFTARGGDWTIDDVYVDPYGKG